MNPEMVLIIREGGLPIYTKLFSKSDEEMYAFLVSSFLSAIHSFSIELNSNEESDLKVELGEQYLRFHKRKNFMVVLATNEDHQEYSDIVMRLADLFESSLNYVFDAGFDEIGMNQLVDNLVYQLFSDVKLKDSDIPEIIQQLPENYSHYAEMLNGKRTINEVSVMYDIALADLKPDLFRLSLEEYVHFKSPINEGTILSYNSATTKRLMAGSKNCSLKNVNGNSQVPCNKFGLEGCSAILREKNIIDLKNINYFEDDQTKEYIDCILYHGYLTVLTPHHRTILMVKKLAEAFLNISRRRNSLSFVQETIFKSNNILNKIGLTKEINPSGDPFINEDMMMYLDYSKDELDEIVEVWVVYLNEIILQTTKHRKKIIGELLEKNEDIFMDLISSENNYRTEKIQEFLFQLEVMV